MIRLSGVLFKKLVTGPRPGWVSAPRSGICICRLDRETGERTPRDVRFVGVVCEPSAIRREHRFRFGGGSVEKDVGSSVFKDASSPSIGRIMKSVSRLRIRFTRMPGICRPDATNLEAARSWTRKPLNLSRSVCHAAS